jgi:hypothetical protein
MVYKLTQKDIDEYNLQGALVGEEATPEDLRIMDQGLIGTMQSAIDAAPDTMQIQPSPMSNPAADTGPQIGDPAFTETPEQAAAMEAVQPVTMSPTQSALLGGGAGVQESNDPFANLSRTQRMMLAFSAIEDAGAALQGKKGGSFSDTMRTFNEIRDMERKRQAQLAQVAASQQMFQALGVGSLPPNPTAEQIDARIAQLTATLASPSGSAMVPFVNAELQRLQPMRERAAAAQKRAASTAVATGQVDALLFDPALDKALGIEGILRAPIADLGLDPETARVRARIDQLKGGAFLQAFESLKGGGQITELEGKKAEDAIGRFKTAQDPNDFRDALKEYRFYLDIGARRAMGENIPPDTIYGQDQKSDPLGLR